VPLWKAHQMTGDRKGTWSLFVTKNWRITFQINQAEIEIINRRSTTPSLRSARMVG
jgi:plasmid maintenance system killer protein